jgi:hypothetical protein
MPERASSSAEAISATLAPIGETTPIPVMTTERPAPIALSRFFEVSPDPENDGAAQMLRTPGALVNRPIQDGR